MALGGQSKSKSTGFNLDSSINTELGVQGGDGTVVRDGNQITTTKYVTTNTLDGGAVKASIGLAGTLFDKAVGFATSTLNQGFNANAQALKTVEGNTETVVSTIAKNAESESQVTMKYALIGAAMLGGFMIWSKK